jgi:hypothetical protein
MPSEWVLGSRDAEGEQFLSLKKKCDAEGEQPHSAEGDAKRAVRAQAQELR